MTLVAGVDIGNSTTEIVIADASVDPPRPVAWDRASTRGVKGTAEAARGAASLLARLERRRAITADRVIMTRQVPVHTRRLDVPVADDDTGSLALLSAGVATPAGHGHAAGRPFDVALIPPTGEVGPIVLVARDPLGFRATAAAVDRWLSMGHAVAAVLLAGDEAALVHARTSADLPIVDGVDASAALSCDLVAVEVAEPGRHVRALADPLWLAAALDLTDDEHDHARQVCSLTYGHRSAVIGRRSGSVPTARAADAATVTFRDGRDVLLTDAAPVLAAEPVGSVESYRLPDAPPVPTDDLWIVDLDDIATLPGLRAGAVAERRLIVSALSSSPLGTSPEEAFTDRRAGLVEFVATEALASRAGALTTPGAAAAAWVIDLGGGTVDAIGPDGQSITAAGCGELMTSAVAHALEISRGAAEWVKRGPASRVESPFVLSDESGERRFVETAAPHGTVGWLVAPGPTGGLPFSRALALAEWRAMRLALKGQVFAANLSRLLVDAGVGGRPVDVVIIGGPAGDDEILEGLGPTLGSAVVGRANVAGSLGHRWAVAYGLVALSTRR